LISSGAGLGAGFEARESLRRAVKGALRTDALLEGAGLITIHGGWRKDLRLRTCRHGLDWRSDGLDWFGCRLRSEGGFREVAASTLGALGTAEELTGTDSITHGTETWGGCPQLTHSLLTDTTSSSDSPS
jgi:hypothetical protein